MNLGFAVPVPDVPAAGNTLPVAIAFLIHIAIAEYTVGAITLATALELWGVWHRNDERSLHYARSVARSYYLLFSLGATFAVLAVVFLTGLWAHEFGDIINRFLGVVGVAFGLFLIITPLIVIHHLTFEKWSPKRHVILSIVLTLLQTAFVVLIVTIDAYLITPTQTGFAAVLNAAYLPLLVHRLIGNVSWAALLLAAVAGWRAHHRGPGKEGEFQLWCARLNLRIGLWTVLLMPLGGLWLSLELSQAQPGYFANLVGSVTGPLLILQMSLVGLILLGGNVALAVDRGGVDRFAQGVLTLTLVGMILAAMPTAVIGHEIVALRYAGLFLAVVATLAHLLRRHRVIPTEQIRVARRALLLAGASAAVVALLMGYIKEDARGTYGIYGVLTQSDAGGHFTEPPGTYP